MKFLFRKNILFAWLLTGTLDIGLALLHYYNRTGKPVSNVLKFISSGLIGPKAFNQGFETILLGFLLHYLIAFLFTAFYLFIFYKIADLINSKFMTGILYGMFIWMIMFFVVLPLSSTQKTPANFSNEIIVCTILIAAIGLPLALFLQPGYSVNHSL